MTRYLFFLLTACIFITVACGTQPTPSSPMDNNNDSIVLSLHISADSTTRNPGDTIQLECYLKNQSAQSVTVDRSRTFISFDAPDGWKKKELPGYSYNGPAVSVIAPGDSSYFGYQLNDFFETMRPGNYRLNARFHCQLQNQETPVELSSSVLISIHER